MCFFLLYIKSYVGAYEGQCETNSPYCVKVEEIDVWGNWDITLRDLIIVDRNGFEIARLNLTYTNLL